MDNSFLNLYNKAKNTYEVVSQLKQKNKNREEKIKERGLRVAWQVLNHFPQEYRSVNYSSEFIGYAEEQDSIAMLDIQVDFNSDFVTVSTYSFSKMSLVPLFSFPSIFLWEALV